MALTVGELVGYLRIDDTDFNRKVDQGERRFQGLGRTVGAATRTIATAMVGAATVTAALGTAAFRVGADFNVLQQNSRAALETILGSAEAAAAQMDRLDDFASNSPFARQVWITAQQQLLGFGVQAERVVPILDAVQQSVAAVGGSNEQIEAITYALAQMQGQGKLTGETFNQLGQYGIDAATILGQAWGKTGAEVREMASKPGGIPVDQVWDPLVNGLLERFGGATEGLRRQWDGATDRVKAAWRDIGAILAAPFIDPMGGGRAVDWANALADALRALQQKAAPAVDLLVRRFGPGLDRVVPLLERARGATNAWDLSKLNGQLDTLSRYAPLVAGTSAALFALGTSNLPILRTFGITGLNPVVAGVAALVAASPELRQTGRDFLQALAPVVPEAAAVAAALADTSMVLLRELTPAARDLLMAMAPVIVGLAQGLSPALIAVLGAAEPVAGVVADVAEVVASLPTPLLAAGAALLLLRGHFSGANRAVLETGSAMVRFGQQAQVQAHLGQTNLAVGALATASMNARGMVNRLGTAMKTAFISNPVGLAVTAIATAFSVVAANTAEAKARTDEYASTLDALGNRTEDTVRRINDVLTRNQRTSWVEGLLGKEAESALDWAEQLGFKLEDLHGYILGNADAVELLAAKEDELVGTGDSLLLKYDRLIRVLDEEAGALTEAERAAAQRALADEAAGLATEESTSKIQDHVDALKEEADAKRKAAGEAVSLREAQIRLADEQERLNEKIKEGAQVARDQSGAVDLNAEATRRADEALLDLWRQQDNVTDAMRRNNASAAELDATIREQRDAFIAAAQQMGYTANEARELANAYGLIPNEVLTKLRLEGLEDASRQITRFIEDNTGRRIRIQVEANTGQVRYNFGAPMSAQARGSVLEFMAAGGLRGLSPMSPIAQMVPPNTWRVVGDRGDVPEAYIPLDGSRRSLAILDEAAARLGRVAVPAMGFAAGAIRGPQVSHTPQRDGPTDLDLSDRSLRLLADLIVEGAADVARRDTASFATLARRAGA